MRFIEVDIFDGKERIFVEKVGSQVWYHFRGQTYAMDLKAEARFLGENAEDSSGEISAPMPGKVLKLSVANGARVKAGELLVIIEAMKMEYSFKAPFDGIVTDVNCGEGDQVQLGQILVRVDASE